MKKISNFSFFVLMLIALLKIDLYSQQCELVTSNIIFESSNSLTFDVYVKNTGASSWVYSHGSLAWNYDPSFLNGGTATFSIVPGYSGFPLAAQPPSALITSPNILRTSSNMPGANGVVPPGQSLRLHKFRLQTSAGSFNGSYFNLNWKNSITPYTRIYGWDNGSGLPAEIASLELSVDQLFWEENFDYGAANDTSLVTLTSNWVRHSGSMGPAYSSSSLVYSSYAASGIGGSVLFTNGGSAINDGDINRVFPTPISTNDNVYVACLVNISSAIAAGDYFFHIGPSPISTTFRGRVFGRSNTTGWSLSLSKSTETRVDDNTVLNFNQTYLVVLKYAYSTVANNDDLVTLYVYDAGIPATEPGSPLVTIGPIGAGLATDLANVGSVAIRQGTNTPTGTIDGIRTATTWPELFSVAAGPTITVNPPSLSGFSYLTGTGPSASQSYNLSATDLIPAAGNIAVAGSTNYEVSTDNVNFSAGFNVGYTAGTLAATPIYIRLKAGLPGGLYNNELIVNSGGGATTMNVVCNGSVSKPEPTNHATGFTGVLGNPAYYFINLSWIDASTGTAPDGYLVKGSKIDFASITDPVDGTPETNSIFVQNVAQGLQAAVFGLNSDTVYYFKIYPYTNSGSIIDYKIDGTVPQFSLGTSPAPALPVVENFEYTTGSNLTANGWVSHSAGGTNPIQVGATPLIYSGYFASGVGKTAVLNTSGEDDNHAFASVNSGSMYASFMVNLSAAQIPGDYFFHMGPENSSTLFFGKVFVKKNAGDSVAFGIAKNVNGSVIYTPFNYDLNTTYLIVVKYTFNPGTTTDDEVKLWINPVLNGTEPAADVTQTDAGTDALSLGMFALRQGGATNSGTLTVGGIRAATTWIPGSGGSTFQLSVNIIDGWNMASIPGLHPVNQNVNTWWANRNPLADVYKWTSTYVAVTSATPTEGYWMLHNGAQTYNTGDEWPAGGIEIVTHNSITVNSGWNMIGGYENSASVAGLTTTPPGLIVPNTVYGWNGTYFNPANLEPGYGYWVLTNGAGVINPPTLIDGSTIAKQDDRSEWGKITITDASGKQFTLYSVNGEVNLDHYQMPPLPPTGAFDVRYASNRKAEDLKEGNQTIEMRGLVYPVTVRVENTNIKLQDETGKTVNARLKSGEEITINSNQINKLLVSENIIPDVYALEQNYPNPFNPSTVIEFSIPEDAVEVRLTIYDALGQRVTELVNTKLEAGQYKYQWDASDVASGLYIYELRTSKFNSVKKMLLMK